MVVYKQNSVQNKLSENNKTQLKILNKIEALEKNIKDIRVGNLNGAVSISSTSLTEQTKQAINLVNENITIKPIIPKAPNKIPRIEPAPKPSIFDDVYVWIKQDFLVKIGAVFIILALSWFVTIGFAGVGAMGRIVTGLIFGIIALVFGYWQMSKSQNSQTHKIVLGQVVTLVGTSILLIDILSARFGYNLIDPTTAFLSCVVVVIFNSIISTVYSAKPVAIVSLVLGYLAPLLVSDSNNNFVGLLGYILILNLSMLIITNSKGWRILQLVAMIGTSLYIFLDSYQTSNVTIWILAGLFMAIFYFGTISAIIKTKTEQIFDIFNSVLATTFGFAIVNYIVIGDWRAVVMVIYAVLVFVVAVSVYNFNKSIGQKFVFIQLVSSLLALILATMTQIGYNSIFSLVGIMLELTACQFLVNRLFGTTFKNSRILTYPLAIMTLLAGFWSFSNSNYFTQIIWQDIVAMAIFFILAAINTRIAFNDFDRSKKADYQWLGWVFGGFGISIFLRWVWVICEAIFGKITTISNYNNYNYNNTFADYNIAHGVSLTIYILLGIIFLSTILPLRKTLQIKFGYSLITLAIIRLLTTEIWLMDNLARVVTFFIIGILLVLTTFINKKNN